MYTIDAKKRNFRFDIDIDINRLDTDIHQYWFLLDISDTISASIQEETWVAHIKLIRLNGALTSLVQLFPFAIIFVAVLFYLDTLCTQGGPKVITHGFPRIFFCSFLRKYWFFEKIVNMKLFNIKFMIKKVI